MIYLKNKLIENNKIKNDENFNMNFLKTLLKEQFEKVDFEEVKKDATRFLFKKGRFIIL